MTGDAALIRPGYSVANVCFADRHLQSDKLSRGKRSREKILLGELSKAIKSAIKNHPGLPDARNHKQCLGNVSDMDQPALTGGLVFGLSKVRSTPSRHYMTFIE